MHLYSTKKYLSLPRLQYLYFNVPGSPINLKLYFRILISFLFLLWCAGIFSEFFIRLGQYLVFFLPFVKKSYSLVCHQQTQKLITIGGIKTMVCARCAGIYIGMFLSSVVFLFKDFDRKFDIKLLLFSSLPMLADVILYSSGIYVYSKTAAFLTGLFFGSVGFLYFYNSVKELLNEFLIRK